MFKFLLSLFLILSLNLQVVFAQEKFDFTVHGESYVVIDAETNEVILGKDVDTKMYPASITKLITAILLADNKKPDDMLVVTEASTKTPEYSINVNYYPMKVGQKLTADFVMKSILIFSANDMAQIVADNLSEELGKSFETIMNDRLKEIGLKNTYFKNSIGLHDDEHYSTAYDLAILLKEALKYDWIREVMGMKTATVTLPDGSLILYENSNKLLEFDGMIGGKTGYTSRAGRTLVGAFKIEDRIYIGTVLKSVYDADDTYVFNDLFNIVTEAIKKEKVVLYEEGTEIGTLSFSYKLFGFFGPRMFADVPAILAESVYIYDNDYNNVNNTLEFITKDNANVNIFTNGDKPVASLKLKISSYEKLYDIKINTMDLVMKNLYIYLISLVILILIIILLVLFIKRIFKPRKKGIFRK